MSCNSRVKLRIKTELHQFDFKEDDNEDSTAATSGQDADMLLSDEQLEETDSHHIKVNVFDIIYSSLVPCFSW